MNKYTTIASRARLKRKKNHHRQERTALSGYSARKVQQLLEMGDLNEINNAVKKYGRERMAATIMHIPALSYRGITMSKQVFRLSNQHFTGLAQKPGASKLKMLF